MESSILSRLQAAAKYTRVVAEPIDIAELLQHAHSEGTGAVVLFSGEVRNDGIPKPVQYLEYEAYMPMAEQVMQEIVERAMHQWKLEFAAAVHRIGRVAVSESAVVVVTAHGHRQEAYEANQYIIERIKQDVPLWKCEYYLDGTHEWSKHEKSS